VKLSKRVKLFIASATIATATTILVWQQPFKNVQIESAASISRVEKTANVFSNPIPAFQPNLKYGFILDNYFVTESTLEQNEFLGDILQKHQVAYTQIDKLAKKSVDIFDVRKMRVGKPYLLLADDENSPAKYMIYEPSPFRYVLYDLTGETDVKIVEQEVDIAMKANSGVVTSSLWNAIVGNDMSYEIAAKMESALAWQVDFHHIQKGDCFKLIYEEQYIDGEAVGIGNIQAAYFKNGDKEFNAFYFEDEKYTGFFDEQGRPMKKAFLKSPVNFARISSAYNLKRFHPVLRRVKAHLGTDYAAPYGTPILAVASGTVTKASRSRGNGNYVKIRHDKTYETQYLHMQKFAKGMRSGVQVKQGDVIGYVGATGLATGPHVCFRFWKNGKQVDHRKENLPPPDPMTGESLETFKTVQAELGAKLAKVQFVKDEDGVTSKAESKVIDP
jgi:murein DD-endopeptidase MepM/ murein hydrolase activator NlpD